MRFSCGAGPVSARVDGVGDKSKAPFPTPHQDEQVAEVLVQLPVLHQVLALVVEEEPVAAVPAPLLQFVRKFIIGQQDLRDRVHDLVAAEVGGRILFVECHSHEAPVLCALRAAPRGVSAPRTASCLSAPGKVNRCAL